MSQQQATRPHTNEEATPHRSAPRDFPAAGRGRGGSHNRHGAPGTSPAEPPQGSAHRHHDSRRHAHGTPPGGGHHNTNRRYSSGSGGGGSSSSSSARYGQWPPPGSSPAEGAGGQAGARSGLRANKNAGRPAGRTFSFNWPAYMDRPQLQQAMKRGQVFRWDSACLAHAWTGRSCNACMAPAISACSYPQQQTWATAQFGFVQACSAW